jgi:hypothetical protein
MIRDRVVLSVDPTADVSAFARIRYAIRDGRVVYAAP